MGYREEYRDGNNVLVIKHADGTSAVYAHMKEGSAKVTVGDSIRTGQHIGDCGTGGSPHLHFMVKFTHGKLRPGMTRTTFSWRWATKDNPEGVVPKEGDFPMRPDSDRLFAANSLREFTTLTVKNDPKRTFEAEESIRLTATFRMPTDTPVTFRFHRPNLSTVIERQPTITDSSRAAWLDLQPDDTRYARGGQWTGYVYLENEPVDSVKFWVMK